MAKAKSGPLMGRKILVTGAASFIGKPAAEALRKAGATVVATTRTHAPLPRELGALSKATPGCVVHCAGVLSPRLARATDRYGMEIVPPVEEAVDQLCLTYGWRLVFLSGTSVYGKAPLPWREEGPVLPDGHTALVKAREEECLRAAKVDACVLRVSSPYGWRQKVRTIVREFIDAALADRDLAYPGEGAQQQDFINVDDVVSAILCVSGEGATAGVYNIATGRSTSLKELAEIVVAAVPGCQSKVVSSGMADPHEGARVRVDVSKAKKLLGWSPRVTLEQGIRTWAEGLRPGE